MTTDDFERNPWDDPAPEHRAAIVELLNQPRGRLPDWGRAELGDPAILVASGRAHILHWVALFLAACADVGAFKQVIGLVMRDTGDTVVWLVVGGFTAVVLYLAHSVGVLLRQARVPTEGHPVYLRVGGWLGRRTGAALCLLVWAGLGATAYWVRLKVPPPGGDSGSIGGTTLGGAVLGGGTASAGTPAAEYRGEGALMFLALYVATGAVAIIGAYLTHHPLRKRYQAAIKAQSTAAERAAASAYQLARAEGTRNAQAVALNLAESTLHRGERDLIRLAAEMKEHARQTMAVLAQDPAVTDAVFNHVPPDDYTPDEGP